MKKEYQKPAIIIGIGLVALYFFIALLGDQIDKSRTDWTPSFSQNDRVPYGSYVLGKSLPQFFDGEIQKQYEPIYNELHYDQFQQTTYLILNDRIAFDYLDLESLKNFVYNGNSALIACQTFDWEMEEFFGFSMEYDYEENIDTLQVRMHNPAFEKTGFSFDRHNENYFFSSLPYSDSTTIVASNQNGSPIAVKIEHGEGFFIICSTPELFTNYYAIDGENHKFIENIFAYFPQENDVIWDEYYKVRAIEGRMMQDQGFFGYLWTVLSYVTSEKALKWGFWLLVLTWLMYVLSEMKRKQRPIRLIKPLPNTTLEFTETIGRLYFQNKDHKNVAEKKVRVLLDAIRSHYFLRIDHSDEFMRQLAGKTGVSEEQVRLLFRKIDRMESKSQIGEAELVDLSASIDRFYDDSGLR